jgi:hypothetical protein
LDEGGEQGASAQFSRGLGLVLREYGDFVADEQFDVLGYRCPAEQCERVEKLTEDQVEQA